MGVRGARHFLQNSESLRQVLPRRVTALRPRRLPADACTADARMRVHRLRNPARANASPTTLYPPGPHEPEEVQARCRTIRPTLVSRVDELWLQRADHD